MHDLTVTAQESDSRFDDLAEATGTLSGRDLQQELGQTLASTLKNESGIALRSMGPAPARPVIRGLGGDRVLLAEDGNKITDLSGTSPDHAVTIEPLNLERIEVLRGPAVLLHSPTTIGGVVNVVRRDIPTERHSGLSGTVATYAESANEGGAGLLRLEAPLGALMVRADIGGKHTSDLSTPIGVLQNSSSEDVDYGVGGSLPGDFGFVGGSFRGLTLDYGIPGGFIGAHPNGVNIEMEKRQHNVRSQVLLPGSTWEHIDFHLSRAYYRHKEFESNGLLGSEFRIVNYLGRAQATHGQLGPLNKGVWGGTFERRDFDIGGHVFTSPAKSLRLATFVFERIERERFGVEAGLRYEYAGIDPEHDDPDASIGPIEERQFHSLSASVSLLYSWNEQTQVGMNVSRSTRTPTIEELYSRGPHLAAYSYEIGNPELGEENGVGVEVFAHTESQRFMATVNAFRNQLNNYIIHSATGDTNWATFLPVYAADGVPALLYGVEGDVQYKLGAGLSVGGALNYTRGKRRDGGGSLPQIPPLTSRVSLAFEHRALLLKTEAEIAAAQRDLARFEEPTDGYATLNLEAQYQIASRHFLHSFSMHLDNLFDETYRNHLSRVKSVMPEAGRNFRLAYKLAFSVQ
ncbi:MAG: TonB-dependent receptor [candidate division Zixibacteria bacterium]|nr:TonB-dependent receptor [candidate division Zixibacteria bacterium]